ncbi:MAG: glycosyltransferase [Rhodobacteraceae bacterium]|nr:glycosyltransferase [Paracoccaceae bacterium]
MKVLLVHQNFPGQFRHVAPGLVARGHEVAVITDAGNRAKFPYLAARYGHAPLDKARIVAAGAPLAAHHAQMVGRGEAAARVAAKLRDERGYRPDVIFAHPGWGETLFLPAVWPGVPILSYAEFYYAATGLDSDFDPEFQARSHQRAIRALAMRGHIAQAMLDSAAAVAPTRFQASTFPASIRHLIEVIHDGIDTGRLRPDPAASFTVPGGGPTFRHGDELLTFVNREIEPYRGAHIFLRALPEVLRARPGAHAVIVGGDSVSYGAPPAGGGCWREVLLAEVGDRLDLARVHFVGKLPYPDFCRLLQASRVHAYLTYPFVLSWSLLEAMSMGAAVIGSRTPPVEEVIEDGVNGRLVDFFDVPAWSAALTSALADPGALAPLRAAARRTVEERYALKDCLPRILDLVERTARAG